MTDTPELTTYSFYDGDFTFWFAEYDEKEHNSIFRVRADRQGPAERHAENEKNSNQSQPNPKGFRPAEQFQIDYWLDKFRSRFPQRKPLHTKLLRRLRLEGPLSGVDLDAELRKAAHELNEKIYTERDFKPVHVPFVCCNDDGLWGLTSNGERLTTVMK